MADADLLTQIPIGVVLRTGDRLAPNPAVEALTGWSADQLGDLDRWFRILFGADADAQRALYEQHRRGGFQGAVTLRFKRRDGSPCIAEQVARSLGEDREIWTLHDITERHLADERFRILFERSTDAHLLFDQSGIIDCNQAAVEMLRCRDKTQLLATHPAVFSPERQPDGRTSLEKSVEMDGIARRDGYHRFDWIHRKLDGTDFPVEVTLNPVDLPSGPALLVVWHDLTQRKEAEQALAEARDRALEGTRAKSVFLANMSHELRTPLNAIIGYAELLMEDQSSDDLHKISHAGRHLLALINDILDLSKIEAGHLNLHCEWFDVTEMAAGAAEWVRPLAGRNGNTVSVEVQPGIGPMYGDPTRVWQVLLNLLGNASKFTRDGALGLRVRRLAQGGADAIELEVWDTGIGIDPATIDRIFDEFVQGDASTTRRFGGTGLGLAITRRLCERMGGSVSVVSAPGRGSAFTVSLPRHQGVPAVRAPPAPEVHPSGLDPDAPLVVVIDDDDDARELIRRTLARGGFRAACASDGRSGIELCRRRNPSAILLDVLMPGHDGWQVLAELKADPEVSSIPVLLVSMLSDRSKGFALGASHYLTKPLDRDELLTTLARYRPPVGPGSALVVEDDEALRTLLDRTLTRSGWEVATARDGAEGLAALRRHRPDLVVLDLMMPVMDGFEFLATVRTTPAWAGLPVVVVTARDLSAPEAERLQLQAQRVLGKGSVTADVLLEQVEQAVRSYGPARR